MKGWGIDSFEGRNSTHQKKKMALDDLVAYRDSLELPIEADALEDTPLHHPGEDSEEVDYIRKMRTNLGGYLPTRKSPLHEKELPVESTFSEFGIWINLGTRI